MTGPFVQPGRESFEAMRLHVLLDDAVRREAPVRWQRAEDDDPSSGTLRRGVWTEELRLSPADPRDGFVRITTRAGLEMVMSWREAVGLLREGGMVLG